MFSGPRATHHAPRIHLVDNPQTEDLPADGWEAKVPALPSDWLGGNVAADNATRSRGSVTGDTRDTAITHLSVYAFRYRHSQSAMTFLLKCVPLGNKFVVLAMAVEV